MLTDIKNSKLLMTDFNYGKADKNKINYQILKRGLWPSLSITKCVIPRLLKVKENEFKKFY